MTSVFYFTNCTTLDELKAEYRRLAMKYHPDRGGDTEIMQRINAEYEAKFEYLKFEHNATRDENHQTTEAAADFIRIIETLLKNGGIEVELCGCWLWISGETREHKDELKAAGCRWSATKKLWYWRPIYGANRFHRGDATMGEIRDKYGSQRFSANGHEQRTPRKQIEQQPERLSA